jgi:uncharacterized membrane protein HdeD (DUF308 family)
VALGVALMILGLGAMSSTGMVWTSLATAFVYGFFLVAAGVVYLVGAFYTRCWGGFLLSLLAGALHLAAGVLVLDRPREAPLICTLLLAAFFSAEGLFRMIGSLARRFQHWKWMLFNGVVILAFGVRIWRAVAALRVVRRWPVPGDQPGHQWRQLHQLGTEGPPTAGLTACGRPSAAESGGAPRPPSVAPSR